jgi:hypothetical protein
MISSLKALFLIRSKQTYDLARDKTDPQPNQWVDALKTTAWYNLHTIIHFLATSEKMAANQYFHVFWLVSWAGGN